MPTLEVEAAFRERFAAPPSDRDWSACDDPAPSSPFASFRLPYAPADPLAEDFSTDEVELALHGRSDTAPGSDGVVYSILRALPPSRLQRFFNTCRAACLVPTSWHDSTTILIPKESGDRATVSGWRPISLVSCVYKTYAALVEARLRPWADQHLLSPGQKGFAGVDGCFEHNFALRSFLEDARRRRHNLGVAFLDIRAAFDTLPHDAILGVLERSGIDTHSLRLLDSLLRGNTASIRTAGTVTAAVAMERGVRQGCPLSPLLFNIGAELLLRAASSLADTHGVGVGDSRSSVLAYADDLVLLAQDRPRLQDVLDRVEAAARWCGLSFNVRKCAALLLRRGNPHPDPVHLEDQPLPALGPDDAYRYLGVPMGWSLRSSPSELIESVIRDFRLVVDSGLLPWQKLDAWRRFLFPRLQYALRHHVVEIQLLSSPHHRQAGQRRAPGADERLRGLFREVLSLPRTSSSSYLYAAAARGGVGLPLLVEEYAITRVVDAVKALASPGLSRLARTHLTTIVAERTQSLEPSLSQLLDWLNGGPATCPSRGTWWTTVRWAVRRLRGLVDVRFELRGDRLGLSFKDPSSPDGRATLLQDATFAMVRALRSSLREYHLRQWGDLRSQGRAAATLSQHQASTSFLLGGRVGLCDWRFAHRARTNTLPLNGNRPERLGLDTRCRRCGLAAESLAHLLQHCQPLSSPRIRRHHGVVYALADSIRATGKWAVDVDQVVRGASTNQRPDLLCRHLDSGRVVLVDIKIPFDSQLAMDGAARRNEEKYSDLAREIGAEIRTFSIGALGSWTSRNDRLLSLFSVSQPARTRDLLLRHVLHWSRNTYVLAVTGIAQHY